MLMTHTHFSDLLNLALSIEKTSHAKRTTAAPIHFITFLLDRDPYFNNITIRIISPTRAVQ